MLDAGLIWRVGAHLSEMDEMDIVVFLFTSMELSFETWNLDFYPSKANMWTIHYTLWLKGILKLNNMARKKIKHICTTQYNLKPIKTFRILLPISYKHFVIYKQNDNFF